QEPSAINDHDDEENTLKDSHILDLNLEEPHEVNFWLKKRLERMKSSIMDHLKSELLYYRYTNEAAVKIISPGCFSVIYNKIISFLVSNTGTKIGDISLATIQQRSEARILAAIEKIIDEDVQTNYEELKTEDCMEKLQKRLNDITVEIQTRMISEIIRYRKEVDAWVIDHIDNHEDLNNASQY
ncbi:hypothetical protein AKO1_002297, partial [Acrasis kona]